MPSIFVKSEFEAEFRRFTVNKSEIETYDQFHKFLKCMHKLSEIPFVVFYIDPKDDDILPINNNDNYARALIVAKPLLRIIIESKQKSDQTWTGNGNLKAKKFTYSIWNRSAAKSKPHPIISQPHDFRQVSAIIDVHLVPQTWRRVQILKRNSDRPLGFYIRDGMSIRVTSSGLERAQGIFISRVMPGGLAETTGLLNVNDEVIEVNGIDVSGKTLDQVKDMMIANCCNLIITVKPANPGHNYFSSVRTSQLSNRSGSSSTSTCSTNTSGQDELENVGNFSFSITEET